MLNDTIYRIACYYGDLDPSSIALANNLTPPYTLDDRTRTQHPLDPIEHPFTQAENIRLGAFWRAMTFELLDTEIIYRGRVFSVPA